MWVEKRVFNAPPGAIFVQMTMTMTMTKDSVQYIGHERDMKEQETKHRLLLE